MARSKSLRAVDSDDLIAHFNLSILYHRKGLKVEAQEEEREFNTKRPDPGAPTYSLEVLRQHRSRSARVGCPVICTGVRVSVAQR